MKANVHLYRKRHEMSPEKMKDVYKKLRKWKRIAVASFLSAFGILAGGIATVIILSFFGPANPLILVCSMFAWLGLLILFAFAYSFYVTGFKEHSLKESLLYSCEALQNPEYSSFGKPSKEKLHDLGIRFGKGDNVETNDGITARYKGVRFDQCDLHVFHMASCGRGSRQKVYTFGGRWVSVPFPRNVSGCTLQIVSDKYHGLRFNAKSKKEAEQYRLTSCDEAFNKRFRTYSPDGVDALSVLTPELIEKIMTYQDVLSKTLEKASLLFIVKGNTLHAGITYFGDAFEPKLFGKTDYETDKKRFLEDLKPVTDLIDCFFTS